MEKTDMNLFDRILGWAILAITALTPFVIVYALVRPNTAQGFFLQIAVLLATLALGIALVAGGRELPGRLTAPAWLSLGIGLTLLGSLTASHQVLFSLKQALLPACALILFWQIVAFPHRRLLLGRIRLCLVVVSLILAVYGILQYFGFELLHYSGQVEKNTVIATVGHPNYLGSVLGPALFVVLSLIFAKRGLFWKGVNLLIIFTLLFCITLARTRGVWLGIVLGLASVVLIGSIYCLRYRTGLRWVGSFALGATLIVAGLAASVFVFLPALNRGIDIRERLISNKEIKSRAIYWRAAIDMAAQKPVFGQGYAMFDPIFWDYALQQQKSEIGPFYYDVLPAISGKSPGHVHNEYLEVLCEQGFTGFVALAAFLGFFALYGYWSILAQKDVRRALQNVAFFGAFVTSLTDAFFGFPWRLPVSLIVFMVVLAWIYDAIYPQFPARRPATRALETDSQKETKGKKELKARARMQPAAHA